MSFITSELLYDWKRDKKTIVVLMLLSMIGIYCVSIANYLLSHSKEQLKEYNEVYEDVQFYTLLDNFIGEKSFVLDDVQSANKMKAFMISLQNSEYFEYLMMYEQPIYIENYQGKDNNIYGYEHSTDLSSKTIDLMDKEGNIRKSTIVKAFWFGDNVVDYFELELSSGRNFENNDFELRPSESISVILGSNYSDEYKIGDTIYLSYVFSESEAKIIGFLEEGSNVYYRGKFLNLDNYVIMPVFQNDEYEGNQIYNFSINHIYTLRNSGVIATKLSVEDIQEIINDYSKEVGLDDGYYITEYDSFAKQNFDTGVELVSFLLAIIVVLIIIAIIFLMGFCIINKINKNKRYYAILMLNGYRRTQICYLLIIELMIVFAISSLFAGVMYILTMERAMFNMMSIYNALGLQIIIYIIIPSIISIILFLKADLVYYLNEEIEGCW